MPLITGEHPFDFFLQALAEALSAEHVAVTPVVHVYLARLLQHHISPRWHPSDTLGDRVAKALEGNLPPEQRRQVLQEVGDMALVFSGLYPHHGIWSGRGSSVTYHIQLGYAAYRHLGQEPYEEISAKFRGLVDALVRLGTEHSLLTATGVLELYTVWHKTHDHHLARILSEQGIQVGPSESKIPS